MARPARSLAERQAAEKRGHRAEIFAACALMLKGYRPLGRRFKSPMGEIDLIMGKRDLVVFVEVKARATHEAALNSITATAKKRIEKAARHWISTQKDGSSLSWRFDVVTVVPGGWPRHHINAW
ncbi:MAG: YraN family protein [Pseudomonadota bacterium]